MDTITINRAPVLHTDGGFRFYEQFRPEVPAGESGWGAKGTLSLDRIRAMAKAA